MEELVKEKQAPLVTSGYIQEVNEDGSPKHTQSETTQTATEVVGDDKLITRNTIIDYLNDANVQKNLSLWAHEFNTRFHGNWFSIAQVVKKTQMKNVNQGMQILEFLILSGLAHREVRQGIMKYKITLTIVEKVKLLRIQQDAYRQEIETLETEIKNLFAKEETGKVADVTNK